MSGSSPFTGTQEEWDALVEKNRAMALRKTVLQDTFEALASVVKKDVEKELQIKNDWGCGFNRFGSICCRLEKGKYSDNVGGIS